MGSVNTIRRPPSGPFSARTWPPISSTELIRLGIGDGGVQVAVPDPGHPRRQDIQGPGDMAEDAAGEIQIGQVAPQQHQRPAGGQARQNRRRYQGNRQHGDVGPGQLFLDGHENHSSLRKRRLWLNNP